MRNGFVIFGCKSRVSIRRNCPLLARVQTKSLWPFLATLTPDRPSASLVDSSHEVSKPFNRAHALPLRLGFSFLVSESRYRPCVADEAGAVDDSMGKPDRYQQPAAGISTATDGPFKLAESKRHLAVPDGCNE